MKSEKGITLISLIIYVIVMMIIITIISTITSYFYKNVNTRYEEVKQEDIETMLDMYFTNDFKNKEIVVSFVNVDNKKQIKLESDEEINIIYTIADDGIYRNKVKIYSGDTENLQFKLSNINTGVIQEKVLLEIVKGNTTFKSYTINIKPQAIY